MAFAVDLPWRNASKRGCPRGVNAQHAYLIAVSIDDL
jgi:hypothetical protein